ncbi:hypothetical protein [Actinomadura sp. 9N407]|uniref:hypothetical protein n=1 Tax=Actinomadura sp. 9N407 TaxID=3375154 RepID=UPI00378F4865
MRMTQRRAERLLLWTVWFDRPGFHWWNQSMRDTSRRAWSKLTEASEDGGPALTVLVRLAVGNEYLLHPRREAARELLAHRWVRDRRPVLRQAVGEHGMSLAEDLASWVAVVLRNDWSLHLMSAGDDSPIDLLADTDEKVRESTARVWGDTAEPLLGALWDMLLPVSSARREILLEVLRRNPHPLSPDSLHTAWRLWLDEPCASLSEFLRTLALPAPASGDGETRRLSLLVLGSASPQDLCRAVISARTPEHVRRIVAGTCAERAILPSDPPERALFLLLAGQLTRESAGQPAGHSTDAAALAAAYGKAPEELRERLRAAITATENLDLIRRFVGIAGPGSVTVRDRGSLADHLVARRAWPELWRLALGLPLAEAIATVQRIEGWRGPDDTGALLDRMLALGPERAAAALSAFGTLEPIRPEPDGAGIEIQCCALSPDGTRLAVGMLPAVGTLDRPSLRLMEFALPEARVIAQYTPLPLAGRSEWAGIVHTGEAVLALQNSSDESALMRYEKGADERIHHATEWGELLQSIRFSPRGLVVGSNSRISLFPPPFDGAHHSVDLRRLRLMWPARSIAVEPRTGRIAVGDSDIAVLDADADRVLARTHVHLAEPRGLVFSSPHRLITLDRGVEVTAWRRDAGTLVADRTARLATSVEGITALPASGHIAAACEGVVHLDPSTLEPAEPPFIPGLDTVSLVCSTPSGDHVAFSDGTQVEVHGTYRDRAGRLLDRPLADATVPADLEAIEALLASGSYRGDAAELLRIFRLCLLERWEA